MQTETREVKLAVSCEMEDFQQVMFQNTKEFVETIEQLCKIGSNIRLKLDDRPSIEEAKILFQQNMLNARKRSVKWNEQKSNEWRDIAKSRLSRENKWSQLVREIYKRSPNKIFRQSKQCRERWINRLDPNICNEPWSKQQEIELLFKNQFNKRQKWSELSALYGRVRMENSLKNKYNSLLKKEK